MSIPWFEVLEWCAALNWRDLTRKVGAGVPLDIAVLVTHSSVHRAQMEEVVREECAALRLAQALGFRLREAGRTGRILWAPSPPNRHVAVMADL